MGERVYVVRSGRVAGKGWYLDYEGGAGKWSSLQRFATKFRGVEEAERCVAYARRDGALPGVYRLVRLVTLSEQLRRAKKGIAELEEQAAALQEADDLRNIDVGRRISKRRGGDPWPVTKNDSSDGLRG